METALFGALISGAISILGIFLANRLQERKIDDKSKINQAVLQNEINHIKEDVKEHNHYAKLFAENIPVIQEQIKVVNHRVADLEEAFKTKK